MKRTEKSKGGRPRNAARERHEHDLGVSARRVQQIIKEIGLDRIEDMAELRLIEKRVMIALRSLQARREEHELDIAKRSVLPVTEVFSLGQSVGSCFSLGLHELMTRLPGDLAGRDEIHVYTRLRDEFARVINDVRSEIAKIDPKK